MNDLMLLISSAQKLYVEEILNHKVVKPSTSVVTQSINILGPQIDKYTEIAYKKGVRANGDNDDSFKLSGERMQFLNTVLITLINQ